VTPARALLWLTCAAMVFLAFAWPYVVSPDPGDRLFKPVAIGTFCVFFVLLGIVLGRRCLR
jgi:hypothetical protein